MNKTGTSITKAADLLNAGKLVAIPTETVYGLASNGLDETCVANIFKAKNRPAFDPMILHTDCMESMHHLLFDIPHPLAILAEKFMPGPLSILVEKKEAIPDITTSNLPKVAIRIPAHPMTRELLSMLDFPLAAPSANPFGYVSPTSAQHVADQLGNEVDYILDGGNCSVGLESTIVEYHNDQVVVLRKGGISVEDIEKVVGPVKIQMMSSSNPKAPGMLKSHYSPRVNIRLESIEDALLEYKATEIAYIGWNRISNLIPIENQRILSKDEDFGEAARNLFAYLREIDNMNVKIAIADLVPDIELGKAINDKLKRAAV